MNAALSLYSLLIPTPGEYWTPGNVEGDDDQFFKLNVGIKL